MNLPPAEKMEAQFGLEVVGRASRACKVDEPFNIKELILGNDEESLRYSPPSPLTPKIKEYFALPYPLFVFCP